MMHIRGSTAQLALRSSAAIVALTCFYAAIFIYEDEQGKYQNRIDNLWVAIDDRAKLTNSTTTALFNKIGELLRTFFDSIFGESLVSLRSIAASANFSFGGLILVATVFFTPKNTTIWDLVIRLTVSMGLCLVPFLTRTLPRFWALYINVVPMFTVLIFFFVGWPKFVPFYIAIFVSILSDILAIVLTRKIFATLSTTLSIGRILISISVMTLIPVVLCIAPYLLYVHSHRFEIQFGLMELASFNLLTATFAALPIAVLMFISLNRLIWPTAVRLTYPLAQFSIITNRAVLLAIGAFCLAVALNGVEAVKSHFK